MRRTGSIAVLSASCLLSIAGLGDRPLVAQTSRATPSVSVRRISTLAGRTVTGDFNGDGAIDLVAHAPVPNPPSAVPLVIALGNDSGGFAAPTSTGVLGAVPLAAGDFNKDGKLDLIVMIGADDTPLHIMLGRGTGSFDAPVAIGGAAATSIPFALVADFDGDGNLDVGMAWLSAIDDDGVLLFQGRGDGTFSDAAVFLRTGMASSPLGGGVADLNGDGKPDIVTANSRGESLSIFLNQGGFNFTVMNRPMGQPMRDVTAADVNGDGKIDLVAAASQPNSSGVAFADGTVSVIMGNGDGSFGLQRDYATRAGAWRVAVGDFNRDGILDVATANRSAIEVHDCGPALKTWDSVSILSGNGDGTFSLASDSSIGNQRSVDSTRYRNTAESIALAEVTGDGVPDLVLSDGVIFQINPPDPNWPPSVTASATAPALDHSVTLRAVADDVDQDVLNYVWSDSAGMAIAGVPNPCITPSTLGVHTFTVTVSDGHGHTASSSVTVDFGGAPPPPPGTTTITVISPTAGQNVPAGTPFTIKWHVEDSAEAIYETTAYFSEDDGVTWNRIWNDCFQVGPSSGPGVPDSRDQQCTWRNPGPPSSHMLILVAGQDDSDGPIATAKSGAFTISPEPGAVPDPWRHQDIGAVAAAGSAMYDRGFFTVQGSGADIWGTADEFHYVYNTAVDTNCCAPGEPFEITTKVNLVQNVAPWTKAGLMIRDGLGASARHASLFITPGKGVAFQRRTVPDGTSISTSGPLITAPVWLKLAMHQTTIAAYYRKNLADPWTFLGQQAFPHGRKSRRVSR
jgi:VCBS repeat protein/Big-like domain-containing protein